MHKANVNAEKHKQINTKATQTL